MKVILQSRSFSAYSTVCLNLNVQMHGVFYISHIFHERGSAHEHGWFDAALGSAILGLYLLYRTQIKWRFSDMTWYIVSLLLFFFLQQYSLASICIVLWPTILLGVIMLVILVYSISKKS